MDEMSYFEYISFGFVIVSVSLLIVYFLLVTLFLLSICSIDS